MKKIKIPFNELESRKEEFKLKIEQHIVNVLLPNFFKKPIQTRYVDFEQFVKFEFLLENSAIYIHYVNESNNILFLIDFVQFVGKNDSEFELESEDFFNIEDALKDITKKLIGYKIKKIFNK